MKKVLFKFLRRKNQEEKAIVALDIGTDVVKAALFTIEEKLTSGGQVVGKRAVIKGYSTVKQRYGDIVSGAITDIGNVIDTCEKAIEQASLEARLKPTQLLMGIAGESIKGATTTESYKREVREDKINPTELGNIVHKLQWRAFEDVRKRISEETGYPEIDIKLVSTAVLEILIDGYKVTNPLGFQGKEVKLSIFNSFAPVGSYDAMHAIADELQLELLSLISEPYALSRAVDLEEGRGGAIVVDIGASSTDLAVIHKGRLMGTKMFGIGGRAMTKRISVELNISMEEAEKLKIAYANEKLEQKSKKIISDIIRPDLEVWLNGIVLALSEFKHIEALPYKILLCGGASKLPEIKNALNNEKWYKKLHFTHTPTASFFQPKDFDQIIDETGKLVNSSDITPLSLVNLGIELADEETVVEKAVRKVIGIMKV